MKPWYEDENFDASDLGFFYGRLMVSITRFNYSVINLGFVHGFPLLYLFFPRKEQPKVLIAAGFHGEEQAGPWALLRYFEIVPAAVMLRVNIGFLPMVNPSGFRKAHRFNDDDDSPNTGFIHPEPGDELSVEGELLMENKGLFIDQGVNGFLTLHEQTHAPNFYTYAFEHGEEPSPTALAIREAGGKFFPVIGDGPIPPPGGGVARNGVVLNEHDGTFEDMLFHNGVPRCYTTETPVSGKFADRVKANMAVIRAFVTAAAQ